MTRPVRLARLVTAGAALLMLTPVALAAPANGAAPQEAGGRVSIEYSAQPRPMVTVRNNYSSPITGLVIVNAARSEDGRSRREVITFDPSMNDPAYEPIASGRTRTFPVGYSDTSPLHPEFKAAIFADGSTDGDPDWVAELRGVRRCFLEELAAVELILSRARDNGLDNQATISLMEQRRSSLKISIPANSATRTFGCRVSADLIDGTAIGNLKHARVGGESGNPQKTIPVILGIFEKMRGKMAAVEASPGSPPAGPKR